MVTTILENADVRTMGVPGNAEAIAWRDGAIVAVGSREAVEQAAGAGPIRIDAKGTTVLPGFIDAHHHASLVALWGGAMRLSPPGVRDIAAIQRVIAGEAKGLEKGRWIFAMDWDETLLAERRAPTRRELDDAAPDHPVLAMHYTCHRAVANSRALELAGIGPNTPEPSGGAIERGSGGVPNGMLIERGMSRVESLARASLIATDAEGFFDRIAKHHRALLAVGITGLADCTVPGDLLVLYREAARRGALTVPTIAFPVSTSGYLEAPTDVIGETPSRQEEGVLSIGPVKLVFDGAPVCAMCLSWWQVAGVTVRTWALSFRQRSFDAMRSTMSLKPRLGAKIRTGIHIYQRAEARTVVRAATDRGWGLAIHAIGNDAIDIALDAFEAAGPKLRDNGLPRLEHASFLDRDLIARIAGVGAAVVSQPPFLTMPALGSAASIPGLRLAAHRWLLDAGVKVAGSSDHPVVGFDPLDGVRAAVTRRTARGHAFDPDQAVDIDEALAMYTRTSAEACGVLDRCGTLEPGKRADLVVLDQRLTEASLASARVRTTILNGVVVHD